jgi:glutamine amidotransferase-like uncharacterized protein
MDNRGDGPVSAQSSDGLSSKVIGARLNATEILEGRLKGIDLLVVPGGRAIEQAAALGGRGREIIREYVRDGGGYVGICAGAFLGSVTSDWDLSLVNAQSETGTRYVAGVGYEMLNDRGMGDVEMVLNDDGLRLFGAGRRRFEASFSGGPVFSPGRRTDLGDYIVLARYKSEVYKHPFQKGTMVDTPAIIAAPFGKGKVILISPHCEGTEELTGLFNTVLRMAARSER